MFGLNKTNIDCLVLFTSNLDSSFTEIGFNKKKQGYLKEKGHDSNNSNQLTKLAEETKTNGLI